MDEETPEGQKILEVLDAVSEDILEAKPIGFVMKKPTKALKSHDKVWLFFGLVDDSSIIYDALYHGKPVFGFTKNEEMHGMMHRLNRLGGGRILDLTASVEDIRIRTEVILWWREGCRYYATQLKLLIEFEEERGDKDMEYWVKYNIRFGNQHLINPTHSLSYYQIYDLDIKASIVLFFFLAYQTVKLLLCNKNKT